MMTNADLTIYNNRGVDKKTARKLYLKTQIKGVSFYTKQQTTVTDQGLRFCRYVSDPQFLYLQIRKGKNTLMLISIGNYLQKKQKNTGRSITEICLEKDC